MADWLSDFLEKMKGGLSAFDPRQTETGRQALTAIRPTSMGTGPVGAPEYSPAAGMALPQPSTPTRPDSTPLTSSFDIQALAKMFDAAEKGDPGAKAAVQKLGAGLTQAGPPSALPAGRPIDGMVPSQLPAGRPVNEMVQAPSPEAPASSPKFDLRGNSIGNAPKKGIPWADVTSILGSALTDASKIVGNGPRVMQGAGGTGLADNPVIQRMQAEQLTALQKKHQMWSDAEEASKSLPQEILADPNFSDLAEAKMAFDKDFADGTVDNPKTVQALVMGLWAHSRELQDILQTSQDTRQVGSEKRLNAGRVNAGLIEGTRNFDVKGVPGGISTTPTEFAKGIVLPQQRMEADAAEAAALNAFRTRSLGQAAQGRQDSLQASAVNRALGVLNTGFEHAITRRLTKDTEGQVTNQDSAVALALTEMAPRLFQLAQQMGIKVQPPDSNDPTTGWVINGQRFVDDTAALQALYAAVSAGGFRGEQ